MNKIVKNPIITITKQHSHIYLEFRFMIQGDQKGRSKRFNDFRCIWEAFKSNNKKSENFPV